MQEYIQGILCTFPDCIARGIQSKSGCKVDAECIEISSFEFQSRVKDKDRKSLSVIGEQRDILLYKEQIGSDSSH